MKQLSACLLAALIAFSAPLMAQEADDSRKDEGLSLMQEGLSLLFEELLKDMEPALRDLQDLQRDFQQDMGPALEELMQRLGDLSEYHAPEVLENGDILIRRKTPEELQLERPLEEGEIEI
ncbi:hypothetical protein [Pseudoruegeria sp. SHC-113]|uniref:hypothetical protein n=1 Tax=Pseudoruegeria sp. SHC-113 TaxID=2855439 RepID=UPI0021BB4508|nr:hypothetical protein [Pseudoruegeria sp. SHC-113]MCT8161497.1 hypothetical protein [Pseudoruegeria sp. SHC-113]